ncbi:hypothetical protein N7453_007809 [Penicillium expansum]|nr:hypothetical protein N7453_007809 [Penicillium expansum]
MRSLFLPLLVAFELVSANPLRARETTAPFKIYAYGKGISGLPVFYRNGAAELADTTKIDASAMATVQCKSLIQPTHQTLGSHRRTPLCSAPFSADVLCLNQGTASENPVTFSGNSDVQRSNKLSNVWSLYGSYVLVTLDKVNFYAKPTGTDGTMAPATVCAQLS